MAYVALYRKWRPKAFSDLVGQEHVSRTLAQAIESGRVGHAYLFSGPRGTGKTSTAKILAKALNCEKGPTTEPCNECESCRRVNDGTSMDVFEIDAASNRGIDEIRELRETVRFAPSAGRYKVYIIDEVHMLTSEAFNALLKTLEEPPAQVVFILATTEIHKVPATIQSRCQRYDFKRIAPEAIEARLRTVVAASGLEADDDALALIAREADGGMRDALSTLDQCASLSGERVTEKLVRDILGLVGRESVLRVLRAIIARDAREALSVVAEVLAEGKDLKVLVTELVAELRAVMVYQAAGGAEGIELYETDEAVLREFAGLFPPESFMPILRRLHEALTELRWTTEPRIAVETALLALCRGAGEPVEGVASVPVRTSSAGVPTGASMAAQTMNEGRIAQLEARITQLEGALAAVGRRAEAPVAPLPSSDMEVPKPVAVIRAKAEEDIGAAKQKPVDEKSSAKPSRNAPGKERTTKNIAPHRAEEETAAAAGAPAFVVTPEGTALWDRLLTTLKTDARYKLIGYCIVGGQFGGMTNERFCVTFTMPFLVMKILQKAYKEPIEKLLLELSGKPLRLEAKEIKQPEAKREKKAEMSLEEEVETLPPDERSFMERSVDLLDGKIVPPPAPRNPSKAVRVAAEPRKEAPKEAKAQSRSVPEDYEDDIPFCEEEDFSRISDDDYVPLEED
ncbi:MAG: DNA polymerase III subunit gamma/tau [Schwartzia sp.]|nr:DNA polymerase III subunit gamma/tau [Schwartzia sp. (in: firmicutes)]